MRSALWPCDMGRKHCVHVRVKHVHGACLSFPLSTRSFSRIHFDSVSELQRHEQNPFVCSMFQEYEGHGRGMRLKLRGFIIARAKYVRSVLLHTYYWINHKRLHDWKDIVLKNGWMWDLQSNLSALWANICILLQANTSSCTCLLSNLGDFFSSSTFHVPLLTLKPNVTDLASISPLVKVGAGWVNGWGGWRVGQDVDEVLIHYFVVEQVKDAHSVRPICREGAQTVSARLERIQCASPQLPLPRSTYQGLWGWSWFRWAL